MAYAVGAFQESNSRPLACLPPGCQDSPSIVSLLGAKRCFCLHRPKCKKQGHKQQQQQQQEEEESRIEKRSLMMALPGKTSLGICCTLLLLLFQGICGIEEPLELDFPQPDAAQGAGGNVNTETKDSNEPQFGKALAGQEGDADKLEQEVIASIEKAELFLQRAESAHVNVWKCKQQINTAIASLALAETYVLEDDFDNAKTHLATSTKNIGDCNKALEAAPQDHAGKAVLYLTKQAFVHIEEAQQPLDSLISSSPSMEEPSFQPATVSGSGAKPCIPSDGTTCQFSSCGQGKSLPACVVGFASGVIGGAKGQSYVVTNSGDNPTSPTKGSLRYGVTLGGDDKGGVWITFATSMVITLQEMLWVRSSTTIDGRGVNVTITSRSIVLAGVKNVILHNFQINTVGETDTVHIFAGSSQVWVDHLTSFNGKLGLVSVVQGSTDVTISNCHLSNPNFNMLLGASDADIQDQKMRVTVYRNWFKDSMQRMPHCRWGYCHVVNNLYTNWGYYAIGARARAKVKSEGNVFISARRPEVTPWFNGAGSDFDMTPVIQSTGDLLLNGSTFHQFLQFGPAIAPQYKTAAYYPPKIPTSSLASLVETCAGAVFGSRVQKCLYAVKF